MSVNETLTGSRFGRRILLPIVIVIAGMGGLIMVQRHVDSLQRVDGHNELLYFPNEHLLRYFTAGLDNVVADFMWYKTVQYTAQEFNSQGSKFDWLEHMIKVVTSLDPHHLDAYRYGGMFLTLVGAEDLGIPILKEGFRKVPLSWEIPYELHTVYLMNQGDNPAAHILASRYALMVAERHEENYKQFYFELAQNLLSGNDMHDEAIALLLMAVEDANDPFLKQQLEIRLLNAYIQKNLSILRSAALMYKDRYGKPIESLQNLVGAELIHSLPAHADEGEYFIDSFNNVRNRIIVAERESRDRHKIERHIRKFKEAMRRNPENLDEVIAFNKKKGYIHPLPGNTWVYDPETDVLIVQ